MTAYNSAYKSGTISSISGDETTVSGFTPAAGDVGRILIVTNGDAILQHREIIGVSGQVLTLAHTWVTNPYIDPSSDSRGSDELPSNGDAVAVTYSADDLVSTDSNFVVVNDRQLKISGSTSFASGAYAHFKDYDIELDTQNFQVGRGGGVIFGYYSPVEDEDAFETNICNIVDVNLVGNGDTIRLSSTSYGLFEVYGGTWRTAGNPFYRWYEDTNQPTTSKARFMNTKHYGNFGGRMDGNRSMCISTLVDSASTIAFTNFLTPVARIELDILDSVQAGYIHTDLGPAGRTTFNRLYNVSTQIFRYAGGAGGGVGEVYEFLAKKSEVDASPVVANVANSCPDHTLRYGNLIRPLFIDSALAPISTSLRTRLFDDTDTVTDTQTITDGEYTEFFARHTDIASVSGLLTLSDGTQYAPYSLRAVTYGKQFFLQTITAEDTFEPNLPMIDDPSITESNAATVSAYTELEMCVKLYDRSVLFLQTDLDDEEAFYFTKQPTSVDAGSADVTLDPDASSVFDAVIGDITVKASSFQGGIITTGDVIIADDMTLTNGVFNKIVTPSGFSDELILDNTTVDEIENTSGVAITITLVNGSPVPNTLTPTSGSITVVNDMTVNFTGMTIGDTYYLEDGAGNQYGFGTVTSSTETLPIPRSYDGQTWKYSIDRVGYAPQVGTIEVLEGTTVNIPATLFEYKTLAGNTMYTGTNNTLIDIDFDLVTPQMSIDIGDSAVSAQEIFDRCERALLTNDGMAWHTQQGTVATQDNLPGVGPILLLDSNIRLRRRTASDVNSGVLGYVLSKDGTAIDGANGNVAFVPPADPTDIAGAVRIELTPELDRIDLPITVVNGTASALL